MLLVANMMELFLNYFDARAEKKHANVHPNMFNSAGTIDESTLIKKMDVSGISAQLKHIVYIKH